MTASAEDILEFWFGPAEAEGIPADRSKLWFGKDAATDTRIGERFGATRDAAIAGELKDWEKAARSRVALIILVDQFSRNLYRNDPRAFEHDGLARAWCHAGLECGHDAELTPIERVFFYLPLEHSESLADQEQSVTLFETLVRAVPADQRPRFEGFLGYARQHRDIVARFGRFPHRNVVLGRESTAEEKAFLEQPGSSF